jgi:hypothetical protein
MLTFLPAAPEVEAQPDGQRSSSRVVRAERLTPEETVTIDGAPDEAVWHRAVPAADFVQREPSTGAPASERTEVRVLYDANRLLLGVTLYDSEPDAILNNQMQRDESFDSDDSFALIVDSFLDGRTGYFFEINPAGAMGDGLITSAGTGGDGGEINRSWDGIWLARVRRTRIGWTAEVELPFRTLNFNPQLKEWGINFRRTVRRKNEESLWSGFALNQGLIRLVNAGRLQGLQELSQGLGLDIKPYVVGHLSSAPGFARPAAQADGDIGLDTFYNVTPALRLNVSVNTDFAETEVDERRVNLTRFPLFFEEKRDFFLEGSSYFDFGRVPGETIVPFFSRQIGRDARGRTQRIDAGAKLTGRTGAFDVGLNTSAFRGNKNLEFSAFYLWNTNHEEVTGGSSGYGALVSYPNDPWTASFSTLQLEPGYDPAVGFVRRRGYRQYSPELEWSPRLDNHRWIRGLEFSVEGDIQTDVGNRLLTREIELTPLQVNTHDGGRYQFVVSPQYERLDEDFEISDGVVLPTGSVYRFTRYQLEAQTADHRVVSVAPEFTWGDFYSGTRQEVALRVDVRPRRGVVASFEAERNHLDLAEGSFTADVYRFSADTQFSPWISLANNLQYDTVSRLLGWQVRFRWIRRPGNDLYLVYTHNWHEPPTAGTRRFETLDNRLATKVVYTLRF